MSTASPTAFLLWAVLSVLVRPFIRLISILVP